MYTAILSLVLIVSYIVGNLVSVWRGNQTGEEAAQSITGMLITAFVAAAIAFAIQYG